MRRVYTTPSSGRLRQTDGFPVTLIILLRARESSRALPASTVCVQPTLPAAAESGDSQL